VIETPREACKPSVHVLVPSTSMYREIQASGCGIADVVSEPWICGSETSSSEPDQYESAIRD